MLSCKKTGSGCRIFRKDRLKKSPSLQKKSEKNPRNLLFIGEKGKGKREKGKGKREKGKGKREKGKKENV